MGGAGRAPLAERLGLRPGRAGAPVGAAQPHPRHRRHRPVPERRPRGRWGPAPPPRDHLSGQSGDRGGGMDVPVLRHRRATRPHRPRARRLPYRCQDPLAPSPRARGLRPDPAVPPADRLRRPRPHRGGGHRLDHGGGDRAPRPEGALLGHRPAGRPRPGPRPAAPDAPLLERDRSPPTRAGAPSGALDRGASGRRGGRQHRLRRRGRGHRARAGERDGGQLDLPQLGGRRAPRGRRRHPLPQRGGGAWLPHRGWDQHHRRSP